MNQAKIELFKQELREKGFCIIKNFFSYQDDVLPIKKSIYKICCLLAEKYLGTSEQPYSEDSFHETYGALLKHDRKLGGIIYDSIKQIPEFTNLISNPRSIDLVKQLLGSDFIGICRGGDGIRIDNPNEDKYRAEWHQEFHVQFGSLNGLVFWSPLVNLNPDMGPVEILIGSHKKGLQKIFYDTNRMDTGVAYAVKLFAEEELTKTHEVTSGLVNAGDLVIMDFLTIHRSGKNISDRSRWSMQFRYFDFLNTEGRRINWANNLSQGNSIEKLYPEYLVNVA